MAGKFEIYSDKAGEFRFRLKSGNGQNILASEGYKKKSSCTNGIESVKKNSAEASMFDKKTTAAGKYSFNLKAKNNQVIGTSQSYETEASRDAGVEAVMSTAPDASIDDTTT